jgi:hypothetical protein
VGLLLDLGDLVRDLDLAFADHAVAAKFVHDERRRRVAVPDIDDRERAESPRDPVAGLPRRTRIA